VSKSIAYPLSALTLLVEQQEGHPTCKKLDVACVGGDNLTAALHVLQLHFSPLQ